MNLLPIPAHEADNWIPLIGWHLDQFSANEQWEPVDFIRQIKDRDRQLWIVWDGTVRAAVLTAVSGDNLKTVMVTHCCGEGFDEWIHLVGVIEDWARELGAERFELTARPGWERIMRKFGMRKTHVVLEKRL